ncbi:hypothetical protein CRG98_030711 [Punica granatum]|uniref:Uncharacterized protein n=1 Tax=Punica granatum TaxID=22663 RepID=A0A2I0IYP7_PUNGR|nr:hypothetical protein CRG98_030711 [Punica granatum]
MTGIPVSLRKVIMDCISTASMQVLWNGEPTNNFRMRRGVRQGCPLSPYIFVLCSKRLAHLINEAAGAEASLDQMRVIRTILDRFCAASGQKVSVAKFLVFFFKTVPADPREELLHECALSLLPHELGDIWASLLFRGSQGIMEDWVLGAWKILMTRSLGSLDGATSLGLMICGYVSSAVSIKGESGSSRSFTILPWIHDSGSLLGEPGIEFLKGQYGLLVGVISFVLGRIHGSEMVVLCFIELLLRLHLSNRLKLTQLQIDFIGVRKRQDCEIAREMWSGLVPLHLRVLLLFAIAAVVGLQSADFRNMKERAALECGIWSGVLAIVVMAE